MRPKEIQKIFNTLDQAGYSVYLVGGAVRDLLTDRVVNDWDFTTSAKPEEILKLFPQSYYNNKFGTVGVNSDLGILEITTMRKEGDYGDFRHPGKVSWTKNIEEDLARRDFTINAIAMDKNNQIIDPFNGQSDIKSGVIKAVGDPNQRFREDALRLLRAIRISTQLEFEIEEKTLEAIKDNQEGLKNISGERIRDELLKILGLMNPYIGMERLREAGIMEIILPELMSCFGVYQEGPKHDREYDIGEHSLLTLKFTPTLDPITRLAALLHDIGKPQTYKKDPSGNVTFYAHDIVGGNLSKKISKRLNLSQKQSDKIFKLIRYHMFTVDEKQTDSAIRRFIKNVGVENISDILALRVGDRLGGGTKQAVSWRMEAFKKRIDSVLEKPFSITDLKVNGTDVMKTLNIKPGKKVGEVLQKLFKEVLEDSAKNTRDYLLKRASELN